MEALFVMLGGGVLLITARAVLPGMVNRVILAWAGLVVLGLPKGWRQRRLMETAADANDEREALLAEGHGVPEAAALQLLRLIRGMPVDLAWRAALEIDVLRGLRLKALVPLTALGAVAACFVRPESSSSVFAVTAYLALITVFPRWSPTSRGTLRDRNFWLGAPVVLLVGVTSLMPFILFAFFIDSRDFAIPTLDAGELGKAAVGCFGLAAYWVASRKRGITITVVNLLCCWAAAVAFGADPSLPLWTLYILNAWGSLWLAPVATFRIVFGRFPMNRPTFA